MIEQLKQFGFHDCNLHYIIIKTFESIVDMEVDPAEEENPDDRNLLLRFKNITNLNLSTIEILSYECEIVRWTIQEIDLVRYRVNFRILCMNSTKLDINLSFDFETVEIKWIDRLN